MTVIDRLAVQMALENRTRAGLKAMEGDFDGTLRRVQRSATLTERTLSNVGKNFGQNLNINRVLSAGRAFDSVNQRAGLLRGTLFATTAAIGGFGAALGSNVFARYADSFTQINNQIRPLTKDSAELAERFQSISKIADSSRSGLRETATLYARIQKSLPQLDVGKTLEVTETIQKALQLGGATTQEAASAAIQFSQALSSNRLGGEELRTIVETPLGAALAKGLGVELGEFRKLSIEGKLTAKVLIEALGKIGPDIAKQFAASVSTLDQALVQADNRLTEYVGNVNDSYGATKLFGEAILGLANNLELLGKIAGPAAIAAGAVFAGRLAGGSAKLTTNADGKLEAGGIIGRGRLAAGTLAAIGSGKAAKIENEVAKKALEEATQNAGRVLADVAKLKALSRDDVNKEFAGSESRNVDNALRDVKKLEDAKLAQAKKISDAQKNLAAVTQVTSRQQIDQTNRAIEAEKKLAKIEDDRRRAANFIKFNPNSETAQKQLDKALAALPAAQQKAADKAAIVTTAASTAQNNAAKERLKYLRQIDAAERAIIALEEKTPSAANAVFATGAARDAAAARGLADEHVRLKQNIDSGIDSLAKQRAELAVSEKAMTRLSRAGAVVGKGLSSAVGFLGGPFGAAITGLVLGMEIFGAAAAKSAADTEKVNRRIAELGITATGSVAGVDKLGESLDGLNRLDLVENLENTQKAIEKLKGGYSLDQFFKLSGPTAFDVKVLAAQRSNQFEPSRRGVTGARVRTPEGAAAAELSDLAERFRQTPEDAAKLRVELDKISKLDAAAPLRDLIKTMRDILVEADKRVQLEAIDKRKLNPGPRDSEAGIRAFERDADNLQKQKDADVEKLVANTIATSSQTEAEKRLTTVVDGLRAELAAKGLDNQLTDAEYRQRAGQVISAQDGTKALEAAISLIKQYEGRLLTETKFDTNAYRVGFSSDTKTLSDGSTRQVRQGDTSTLEEANRDLYRRASESLTNIREQIGAAIFDSMSESQKAVLASIGYNFSNKGLLPKGISGAAQTGDIADIAQAIRKFGNTGVNAKRGLGGRYNDAADTFLSGNSAASKIDAGRQDFSKLIAESEALTRAKNAETEAIGKNVYQKTLAAETERLFAEATKDGRVLSEEETAALNKKAEAFARAESAKATKEFEASSKEDAAKKVADLNAQAEAYGKVAGEAAKLEYVNEQIAKAAAEGRVLTDEQTASINALGDAIAAAAAKKAASDFQKDADKNTKEKFDALQKENDALGLNAAAAQAAAFAQDLYNLAKSHGLENDAATIAGIDERTAAFLRQAQAQEKLKKQQSDAVAINDEFKSSLKGFVIDMKNGANVTDAALSALTRFADKLLDMALDGLLTGLFGGTGGANGGAGGIGGFFSSLIGGIFGGGGGGGGFAGFYAGGGRAPPNSTIMVGEDGPELMNTGSRGAFITPNHMLRRSDLAVQGGARMGASGGSTVHLTQNFYGVAGNSEVRRVAGEEAGALLAKYSSRQPRAEAERQARQ